jgi:rhamnopyranosyl-N-acetylglucosaminyl-diphospho-decaprenol beta-1,3/1,4-galactofuranosyltransferase
LVNSEVYTKEKVAAVVVTYNRKELLKECIDSLFSQTYQIDAIIVVDNASTDGTHELLMEKGYLNNSEIDYIRLPENTGGAGGFYEGIKKAYERGINWIWIMDDDVKPKKDCLELLLKAGSDNCLDFLALQPARESLSGERIKWYPYFSKIILRSWNTTPDKSNSFCFEGALINSALVDKIGFPNKGFFTVLDDTEYGLRILSVSKLKYVDSAVIIRQLEMPKEHSSIKRFYFFRNLFLLSKLHRIPFIWVAGIVFIQVLFSICKTIFSRNEKRKWHIVKLLIKSYLDGFKSRFGHFKNI